MTAQVKIRDAARFLSDLDVVRVASFADSSDATVSGLRILTCKQEYTIHEYAHAVTLGLRLGPDKRRAMIPSEVMWALNGRKDRQENEVRTIAAEAVILRALDAMEDQMEWLNAIEMQTGVPQLLERVLRKTYGRRWRAAQQDAEGVVRRIRSHAYSRRRQERSHEHRTYTVASVWPRLQEQASRDR